MYYFFVFSRLMGKKIMIENPAKIQFNEQIRERSLKMSVDVHDLFVSKKVSAITRPIVNQIIRSSSSVAANYRAATRSRSDAEFFSKICIVVEECDETQFWLEYLVRVGLFEGQETKTLRLEIEQLVKLFTSIKRKMKEKLKAD
jgi:four helix bundle protein